MTICPLGWNWTWRFRFIIFWLHLRLVGTRKSWPVSFFEVSAVVVFLRMFKESWRVLFQDQIYLNTSPQRNIGINWRVLFVVQDSFLQVTRNGKTRGRSCRSPQYASGPQSCGSLSSGSCGSHGHPSCGFLRNNIYHHCLSFGEISLHFGLHAESWMYSTRRDRQRSRKATITSFQTARDKRNFSDMWRLAHRLSGRLVGHRKRVYYQMAASTLGVQEWSEFLSLAGHQGGSGAQVANRRSSVVCQRISWQKAWFKRHNEQDPFVSEKRHHLGRFFGNSGGHCSGLRKVLIQRDGETDTRKTLCDQHAFCSVYANVVRFGSFYDTMLVDWVSAQACPLDKNNGKEVCEAVRLINIVEEMGNSFVGTLLERGIRSAWPFASGYQHGRSLSRLSLLKGSSLIGGVWLGATSRSPARMSIMHLRAQGTINKMHVWVLGFAMVTCVSGSEYFQDVYFGLLASTGGIV